MLFTFYLKRFMAGGEFNAQLLNKADALVVLTVILSLGFHAVFRGLEKVCFECVIFLFFIDLKRY
jgi:hypothetical protein